MGVSFAVVAVGRVRRNGESRLFLCLFVALFVFLRRRCSCCRFDQASLFVCVEVVSSCVFCLFGLVWFGCGVPYMLYQLVVLVRGLI